MSQHISIIIPTLDEQSQIVLTLHRLRPFRDDGHEVIVVDGGSTDKTREWARPLADHVLQAPRGRALQMNAGAEVANGTIFWFLHADTTPPPEAVTLIQHNLATSSRCWGRFDVRLSGSHPLLRIVERMMNLRSRLTGIATGDQGIFVRRESFEHVGEFPAIPLMEDITLSQSLKRISRPACITHPVVASSRRWERNGVIRTILLMWRLRLAYALGVSVHRLARDYR